VTLSGSWELQLSGVGVDLVGEVKHEFLIEKEVKHEFLKE
jgi:hypothetical protein